MTQAVRRCAICQRAITLAETYLLADGPTSDVVRDTCRACYIRGSRQIRQAVKQEGEEGFAAS